MLGTFADIAAEAKMSEIDSTARQLMLLRDGAMVNGYLGTPSTVAETLGAAFAAIITTQR